MEGERNEDGPLSAGPLRILKSIRSGLTAMRRFLGHGTQSMLADFGGAFEGVRPRWVLAGVAAAGLLAYLLSGVYVVAPGEAAVVRVFGAVVEPRAEPGLHYQAPWPFGRVDIVDVNDVRRETVGLLVPEEGHEHPEALSKLQALSGDTNVVNLAIIVQYQVRDPAAFLFNVRFAPYRLVRTAVRQAVTSVVTTRLVDAILTSERQALQVAIRAETQRRLDDYESGLAVVGVDVQKAFPPDEVADAFVAVNSAREERAQAVNEAVGYANSLVPRARGEARQVIARAKGYEAEVLARAEGDSSAFAAMLAEYRNDARVYGEVVTWYRLYLETMEQVLPRARVYAVNTANGGGINIRLLEQRIPGRDRTADERG